MNKILSAAVALLAFAGMCACQAERRKSDAELGLNEQQAIGRRIYDQQCIRCHEPYSRWGTKGPSLTGIYKKQFMPSGLPVNDERMHDVIMMGKAKMPAFNQTMSEQQLQNLLAYLKTL